MVNADTGRSALAVLISALLAACGSPNPNRNAASREYFTALEGKNTWMPVEEQLKHVSRAIELDPTAAAYWQTRAGYYVALKNLDAARSDLDHAIALHDRPYLRFLRGQVLCEQRAFKQALADLDRAIAVQPENTQFYGSRAIARVAERRLAEALADAERMIARNPRNPDGYYARGVALAALGRRREAIEDFTKVIREGPELSYHFRARARIYEQLGDRISADADRAEAAKAERSGPGMWASRSAICVEPWAH